MQIARDSIVHGLRHNKPPSLSHKNFAGELGARRATFVTLFKNNGLRGCIGILKAVRPLVEDIAHNAYAAAFSDSRFPPLSVTELQDLKIHISTLSVPEPLVLVSEEDLLSQIKEGEHGLILKEGKRQSTFLPSVWEQIKNKREFLTCLKRKAGLPDHYWSKTIKFEIYTTFSFGEK